MAELTIAVVTVVVIGGIITPLLDWLGTPGRRERCAFRWLLVLVAVVALLAFAGRAYIETDQMLHRGHAPARHSTPRRVRAPDVGSHAYRVHHQHRPRPERP